MVSPSKGIFHPDLEGAKGKQILFRPPRYDTKELLGNTPMFVNYKDFDGRETRGKIRNLSSNGLAFEASAKEVLRNGELLRGFQIRWEDQIIYDGEASVTNQREAGGVLLVGCALKSGNLDTETIHGLKEKVRIHNQLTSFRQSMDRLFQSDIPVSFRALVGDLRLFLERYKKELDGIEAGYQGLSKDRLRWEREVIELAEPEFTRLFRELELQLYKEVKHLSGEERKPYRDYSQYQLHHLFEEAPVFHRSYHKPLGYAGDYQVLLWIYAPENHYEGDSLFGKLLHRIGCTTTASLAGISRIPFLTEKIKKKLSQHESNEPMRLFSLASGPAKEILDLLQDSPPQRPLEITLFDQDEEALAFCHTHINNILYDQTIPVDVHYLHSSVKQIIQDREFVDTIPKQDMITSTGLFDYLPTSVAMRLLNNLISMLKPDGIAIIGNFAINDTQYIFEYMCDWDLIYRDAEDLMALTRSVTIPIEASIEAEETGTNLFLVVRRKA